MSAGEKVLVYRPLCKGKLTDNLISALYRILPESCIQQIVHQAGSSATYVSNCQIPLPPAILLGEAMDGSKHKTDEWGWTISNAQMQPNYTDHGYEPDELLSQNRCNCKTNCLRLRWTCRKQH